jgi:hypothetical protein
MSLRKRWATQRKFVDFNGKKVLVGKSKQLDWLIQVHFGMLVLRLETFLLS